MTCWNEKQASMSLVHGLRWADNGSMTNQRPTQETTTGFAGAPFSAAQFRQAMGPGYQVATFREQPVLNGCQPTFARPIPLPKPNLARRPRLQFRFPFRIGRGLSHRLLGALVAG